MQYPFSWRRLVLWLVSGLLTAQLSVLTVLASIAEWRKRRRGRARFPYSTPSPLTIGADEVCLYTYGADLYAAMLTAIESARESIYLETFIWKGDVLGKQFKAALARKAAEGVRVYVIFDGFANLVVPPHFKRFPITINMLEYRTLRQVWYIFDPRRYARDHRKLLIVDHAVAFIGGFNIGQLYATQWRDTHLAIRGPTALDLAHAFVDFWNNNRGRHPAIPPLPRRAWPRQIRLARNDPARLIFPIRGMYLEAIERAQRYIYCTNAYFIPDRVILSALIAAAQRGVDVRILLPWQSNHVSADWLARGFFDQCLRNGIRIFGYKDAMIHAKTATIDGIWSTIGTANLDRLSLVGNYEINVEIIDAAFATLMQQIFLDDTANAFELTLAEWERRPWYARMSEAILSPLRPLL